MPSRRRKTLPPVSPKVSAELRPLVAAIAEIIETGEGVRGDPLDRKLTLRDLVDSGIGKLRAGALAGSPNALEPNPAPPNRDTPPTPDGFNVSGGFDGRIDLTWTIPGSLYGNHAYTNVYRAETDNFANAILVGREAGSFYTDNVRDDATIKTYYYWITFTSTSDVEGPVNATAGTPGAALVDVAYLLETLTENLDDEPATLGAPDETLILHAKRFALRTGPAGSPVYPLVVADVNGTPTVVLDTTIIRDGAIQEGQIGALTFGKLEAADGTPITTVGGLLKADYIDADNLSVAEAATFYDDAQSGNFATGTAGWKLWQIGDFEAYNATIRGHIEADTGYIAQTLQIGGTAKDVGDLLAMENKVTDWTRPGTTLINGNKIFTGDAYVDTLQIKGQAVTFPRGASSSSNISVDSGGVNVLSLAATTTGAPILVTITVEVVNSTNTNQGNFMEVSVRRDGTTIAGPYRSLYAFLADISTESTKTYNIRGVASAQFYFSSSSSGTYYINCRTGSINDVTVSGRSMTIIEAKR